MTWNVLESGIPTTKPLFPTNCIPGIRGEIDPNHTFFLEGVYYPKNHPASQVTGGDWNWRSSSPPQKKTNLLKKTQKIQIHPIHLFFAGNPPVIPKGYQNNNQGLSPWWILQSNRRFRRFLMDPKPLIPRRLHWIPWASSKLPGWSRAAAPPIRFVGDSFVGGFGCFVRVLYRAPGKVVVF